jgi:secretion/DNA translocation related TadE-like protein
VLVVVTLLTAAWVGMASVGAAVVARHRASAAADLAALAAASAAERAIPNPCGAAREIAELHGGHLAGCRLEGLTADVVVTVEVGGVLAFDASAAGRSRAGPGPDTPAG